MNRIVQKTNWFNKNDIFTLLPFKLKEDKAGRREGGEIGKEKERGGEGRRRREGGEW